MLKSPTPPGSGRLRTEFEMSSCWTKRRRSEELSGEKNMHELLSAAIILLKTENRTEDCKILSKIMSSKEDGSFTVKRSSVYSPRESLAIILDCKLSNQDYQTIRTGAKNKDFDIYPAYNHVLDAKEECIPSEGIKATDYAAEVGLQELLDHTAKRILENIEIAVFQPYSTLTMIHKVGIDGSTGHSVYKQVTSEDCERAEASRE